MQSEQQNNDSEEVSKPDPEVNEDAQAAQQASAPEGTAEAASEDKAKEEAVQAARQELLDALEAFASKRWDTNLATQTLRRLTDRRKEVIGQLWEAVEHNEADALLKAEKFVENFRNTMDARRRLEAVVRLMGRGDRMDPRTAKWFTDSIEGISEKVAGFVNASNG